MRRLLHYRLILLHYRAVITLPGDYYIIGCNSIDNLVEEALACYYIQKHKPLDDHSLGMIELVKQTTLFPAVRKAIL